MNTKHLFPLFMDLSERKIVVVGAGPLAAGRVKLLLDYCDDILVVAPLVNKELLELEQKGFIRIYQREFERDDIYDADMVLAATDNIKLNDEIYSVCKCLGIMVNVASNPTKCDFQFPSAIIVD